MVLRRHQECERHFEGFVDRVGVQPKRTAGRHLLSEVIQAVTPKSIFLSLTEFCEFPSRGFRFGIVLSENPPTNIENDLISAARPVWISHRKERHQTSSLHEASQDRHLREADDWSAPVYRSVLWLRTSHALQAALARARWRARANRNPDGGVRRRLTCDICRV